MEERAFFLPLFFTGNRFPDLLQTPESFSECGFFFCEVKTDQVVDIFPEKARSGHGSDTGLLVMMTPASPSAKDLPVIML